MSMACRSRRAPIWRTSKSRFALGHAPISTFVDAVKALRPTGIIGVSTVPKLFNREVITAMAELNERSIIFPYSNPKSRSECTAEEAYRWSEGRQSLPAVEINGRRFVPGKGNNAYIVPAMGMAVFAIEAARVSKEMFIVAAQAVAEQVSEGNLSTELIYPPQSRILEASLYVAERITADVSITGLHGFRGWARWFAPMPTARCNRIEPTWQTSCTANRIITW
jgi:malate dehydrogenase (oxaloacetate-decarboxylating)(NADP+)